MNLLIMRHAEALSKGYANDFLRPLSEKGKKNLRLALKKMKERGLSPSLVLSSPLLRAMQTAEISAEEFNIEIQTVEELGDQFDLKALLDHLKIYSNTTILLIGHAPTLGYLIETLLGKEILDQYDNSAYVHISFDDRVAENKGHFLGYFTVA